jgi:hypothetical protein
VADLAPRPRRLLPGDSGVTVVELSIAMVMALMLSTVMITWVFAGFGSDSAHRSYDEALADVRNVSDQLSREVRAASTLTLAEEKSVSFWLDSNRNTTVESGETITWTILTNGDVTRSVDGAGGGTALMATHLDATKSSFLYDATDPGEVGRITIQLVALAETQAGLDEVVHGFDIYLRNI